MKRAALFIAIAAILFISGSCAERNYELRVASYNIRNANPGDSLGGNGWHQRGPIVAELIRFHDFDIFGLQEVVNSQLNDLLAVMPEYRHIGVGRTDGKTKGEYSPVFYKHETFDLLESGDFWLSETPSEPSKGWDAAVERICSWGRFRVRENGFEFWFFNLHMDHRGTEARRQSAKLVLDKIADMCGNDQVVLTGDFNVDQNNESYLLLSNSAILSDSYELAGIRYALNGTFNNFKPDAWTESRIDHIFVTNGFSVQRYGILTDSYRYSPILENITSGGNFPEEVHYGESEARMPSDHFPIIAILEYKK